jgi:hypothetical protein
LDAGDARLQNHRKTTFIINNWDADTAWADFGVRANIVVRLLHFICHNSLSVNLQPFTSYFPRADIHELLTPDLLHQVIKGTFKDHIVMWVNAYLLETHGEARGLEIIADIDHRYGFLSCDRIYKRSFLQFIGSSPISRATALSRWLRFPTMDGRRFESTHEGQFHAL